VGTVTDQQFYERLASVYRVARTRYPMTPAREVLRTNPDVTVEQLRRAVHRATKLGLLERVRMVEQVAPEQQTGKQGKGKGKGKGKHDGAPAPVRLPDLARIWRDEGTPATVGAVAVTGGLRMEPDAARALMQTWVDAGLATWTADDAVTLTPKP
jgi:isoaspartyl peptidase/L-asparaginase-like protein (Ntn-hydrolase superfamily)